MKVQLNNVYRTPLYREVSKGKPKHLRLALLNALKEELVSGTDIVWSAGCLMGMGVWRTTELGYDFWSALHSTFKGETLND